MARRVFPQDPSLWSVVGSSLRPVTAGGTVEVFLDPDPTGSAVPGAPADIRLADGSAPTVASQLTTQAYSSLPVGWLGPDGSPYGPDTLIVVVNGGPPWRIYARQDDRLDAAESAIVALQPGGGSAALRVAQNLADLASASTARTNLGLGTAATQAASAFQAADADLTAIAGLTPASSAVIQESGGSWSARTPTQLAATLPADQAAGTASLRTLGTGAAQAAAGNHSHTVTLEVPLSRTGTLTVLAGSAKFPVGASCTVVGVRLAVGTAPTGADLIVDLNKNGTTIFTTQANRPRITAGQSSGGPGSAPDVASLAAGDLLSLDVDQVGSTVAGADLTVVIVISRAVS